MAFTREDIAVYEKQAPAQVTIAPAAHAETVVPVETQNIELETSDESSTNEAITDPTVTGEDGLPVENEESTTSPADTPDSVTQPDGEDDGKPLPRGRAQERIMDLIAERDALRKFGEYMTEQLKAREVAPTATTTPTPATVEADSSAAAPTLEDHNYDPVAYQKAQTEWLDKQISKRVEQKLEQERSARSRQAIADAYAAREAKVREANKDYDLVIRNPALPKLAASTAGLIVQSEVGPQLVYHLAKNPDIATRISRMAPEQQHAWIGRLEDQLAVPASAAKPVSKPVVNKKTVTNAPTPPTPIPAGNSNARPNITDPALSMDEFVSRERSAKIERRQRNLTMRKAMR